MPGCGKSTFGKNLAEHIGVRFLDLDKEIVRNEKMTIPEIFETKGEDAFRIIERDTLQNVLNNSEQLLLATGGGAPCFFDNMERMTSNGLVIFLNADLDYVVSRVLRKKHKRPLIKQMDDASIADDIKAMYKKRLPFYKKAQIVLGMDEIKIEAALSKIQDCTKS